MYAAPSRGSQRRGPELSCVRALLLLTFKICFRLLFWRGLSKHVMVPHTSSWASQLKSGRVSGGAPPMVRNYLNGTMWKGSARSLRRRLVYLLRSHNEWKCSRLPLLTIFLLHPGSRTPVPPICPLTCRIICWLTSLPSPRSRASEPPCSVS